MNGFGRNLRLWLPLLGIASWAGLIFATSCTVIRPQEFFDWVHRHIATDEMLFARFQAFWAVSWFVVVKGWHFLEFAILFRLCLAVADAVRPMPSGSGHVGLAIVICVLYAISDEWHQTFVPDRGGVASDVLIDCLGVLCAAWLVLYRRKRALALPSVVANKPIAGGSSIIPVENCISILE
jgi:hypothetical protein